VVVGDAAGFTLNTGLTVRGMDLAIGSAIVAAQAVDQALVAGHPSSDGLSAYPRLVDESFVGQDMRTYAKAPAFLERPRTYTDYGPLAAQVLHDTFNVSPTPRRPLRKVAAGSFKRSPVKLSQLVGDGIAALRSL
jgi:electron transfer flavoprotein-quinone oxidoreductase